jgi:hypothetical protein
MSQPTTTLAKIKAAGPCQDRWRYALHNPAVKKIRADTPITVRQIVETVGLNDALWCLRAMPGHDDKWRLFAVSCARRVQHLMTDPRSVAALDVAERYALGQATDEELAAARAAASDGSSDAAWAASNAAWAASDAAWAAIAAARAASDAARAASDAAWAARAAAWAAIAAARAAASDAEREWQAAELIRICEEIEP